MAMKITIFSLMVLLLMGCLENDMKETKEMWDKVLNSKNADEEADNIRAVKQFIADKGITIVVNVTAGDGKTVNINALPDNETFTSVLVIFDTKEGEMEAPAWKPKDNENVYLLFLE
jgi:hypothetical protein